MSKPKIAEWKKERVEHVKKLLNEYPTFGIVNMVDLPTLQLQRMRSKFKDKALLIMTKKRLIRLAINQLKDSKKGIEKMVENLEGMPALILTKEDPFKLSKILSKGKSAAAAKAGQVAPNDIVIPAGPTPFAPGPVIGELGQIGIKTEVKEGKIHVKEDKIVVKEGDIINSNVAGILSRLGIEPMEVGLSLIAVYDNGLIYTKDVLSVDEKAYIDMLKQIHLDAVALSVGVGYATGETVSLMLAKVEREVNALVSLDKVQNLDFGENKMEEESQKDKEEKSSETPQEEHREEETSEDSGDEGKEESEETKEEESSEEEDSGDSDEEKSEEEKEESQEEDEEETTEKSQEESEEEQKPREEVTEEPKEETEEKQGEEQEEKEEKEEPKEESDEDKKEDNTQEDKHYDKGGKELEDKELKHMKTVEQLTRDILEGKKVGG